MSLSKQIAHLAFLTLVSITTFFGSPGLPNVVLCLGNDGHLELEYSVNGKCGTNSKAPQAASLLFSESESHCGPCTDVSFIGQSGNTFRLAKGGDAPQNHSLATCPVQVFAYLDHATPGLLPQPPPLASQHLVHLRTIRLLV